MMKAIAYPMLTSHEQEILTGLTHQPKYLSSKLFYDTTGLMLYNEIMSLPEYYLVNCDLEILNKHAKNILHSVMTDAKQTYCIIDLGAGNAMKTKILLQNIVKRDIKCNYIPIDVDSPSLTVLQTQLAKNFPTINIKPMHGDYFNVLRKLRDISHPKLVLFLGSSIGNLTENKASEFFNKLNDCLNLHDKLLVGFDLIKDPSMILDAYNDKTGVTRQFNLNLLTRLNKELEANFDLQSFMHYPTYDPINFVANSYLISLKQQTVKIKRLNIEISFQAWEPIHTETSYKYNLNKITKLARSNHYKIIENFYDSNHYFVNSLWSIDS